MTRVMRIHGYDRFGGPEVEAIHRVSIPTIEAKSVRIRVTAVSMNPGDIKVRSGQRQDSFPSVFPMAMGREAAGVVLELGDEAPEGLVVGQRVVGACARGIGALGGQTLLTAESATLIPDGVDDAEAACIPVAVGTALDAIEELRIGPGDRVLALGAGGGVGVHAIQFARYAGAQVIGVAGQSKRDLVERFGAVHVSSGAGWEDRVRALTPDGADALLDCVGGEVLTGGLTLVRLPEAEAEAAGADVTGAGPTRVRSIADPAAASAVGGSGVTRRRTAAVFARIAQRVADGGIEIVLDEVIPFSQASRAVAAVERGHARGKTVASFDSPYGF